jgi:hypothetical protein
MSEIKPCPFCGSENVELQSVDYSAGDYYFVECKNDDCLINGPERPSILGAVDDWNTRHETSTVWVIGKGLVRKAFSSEASAKRYADEHLGVGQTYTFEVLEIEK